MALFANLTGRTAPSPAAGPAAAPVSPLHHVPPSPRELRAQAVHRLQVGMFGLAGMLLLVSLANVIMDRAQSFDNAAVVDPAASASTSPASANDPLVDMGVVPELPVNAGDKGAPKPSPSPRR